jgi:bifunctional N-acetylglucosamine-1-phosphate-uridyltransferase/glucosamine-1-phosphate-acetyltransferase GlmU-like protein
MDFLKPESFFDLSSFDHRDLFMDCRYAWQSLERISSYLQQHLNSTVQSLNCFRGPLPNTLVLWRGKVRHDGFELLGGDVTKRTFRAKIDGETTTEAIVLYSGCVLWDDRIQFGPGSVVEPGALIKGPTIIGAYSEVRQGAYIRGKCIVGSQCVVGHTTEMKSSVMLDGAKAGHFAYIGDSILGDSSNLGAGTKLANLKIREGNVILRVGNETVDTGLRKFGAILGDKVEIGCNAVTNPGTLLGKGSMVFPVTSVRAGYYEPNSIVR